MTPSLFDLPIPASRPWANTGYPLHKNQSSKILPVVPLFLMATRAVWDFGGGD